MLGSRIPLQPLPFDKKKKKKNIDNAGKVDALYRYAWGGENKIRYAN